MKTPIVLLLLTAVLGGGSLYVRLTNEAAQNKSRVLALEDKLRQAEARVADEELRNQNLQARLNETHSQAAEKATEATQLKAALAKPVLPAASPEPASSAGARLLMDPSMRATMKKQHLEGAQRTINQLVSTQFIERLNLNEDQARFLKELLGKKAATGVEMLMALMGGEDETRMAELGRELKREKEDIDAQIKALLGDEGYKVLEWQEDSQTERGRLKEFRARFEGAGHPLSLEQEDQLLLAMYEERRNFSFQNDYNDPSKFDYEHLQEFLTEDKFNVFFQEMERLNEKIRLRAQGILTPEQLNRFGALQQDQLEKSRMTIKMTQALFPVRRPQ